MQNPSTTTELLLSNVEDVLAGTLALMTAMAQGCAAVWNIAGRSG